MLTTGTSTSSFLRMIEPFRGTFDLGLPLSAFSTSDNRTKSCDLKMVLELTKTRPKTSVVELKTKRRKKSSTIPYYFQQSHREEQSDRHDPKKKGSPEHSPDSCSCSTIRGKKSHCGLKLSKCSRMEGFISIAETSQRVNKLSQVTCCAAIAYE